MKLLDFVDNIAPFEEAAKHIDKLSRKEVIIFYPGSAGDLLHPLLYAELCFKEVKKIILHLVDPELFGYDPTFDMQKYLGNIAIKKSGNIFSSPTLDVHVNINDVFIDDVFPKRIDLYFERAFDLWTSKHPTFHEKIVSLTNGFLISDAKALTENIVHVHESIGFYGKVYVCR